MVVVVVYKYSYLLNYIVHITQTAETRTSKITQEVCRTSENHLEKRL